MPPTLSKFFDDAEYRNVWVKHPHYKLYVRRTHRHLEGLRRSSFDIASIDAKEPAKGHLSPLFDDCERWARQAGFSGVYVENVIPTFFRAWLERRGYRAILTDPVLPSYWKDL